jgi:hypothetical protein
MTTPLLLILHLAQTMSPEEIPHFLGELEEIRSTAFTRLIIPAQTQATPDELLDAIEAAPRLGVSVSYIYHHHDRFPFTRRQGRNLLFSSKGIEDYIRRKKAA